MQPYPWSPSFSRRAVARCSAAAASCRSCWARLRAARASARASRSALSACRSSSRSDSMRSAKSSARVVAWSASSAAVASPAVASQLRTASSSSRWASGSGRDLVLPGPGPGWDDPAGHRLTPQERRADQRTSRTSGCWVRNLRTRQPGSIDRAERALQWRGRRARPVASG